MKCLKWIAAIALSASSVTAFAADIPATTIMDNYIGAGYSGDVYGSKSSYDIDKMTVSRTGAILSVDIFTSFYNNIGESGIRLGDLFMAAGDSNVWNPNDLASDRFSQNNNKNNTGTNWEYALDLGSETGSRKTYGGNSAWLRSVSANDLKDSNKFHGDSSRKHQVVMMGNNTAATNYGYSSWSMGGIAYTKEGINYGALSFTMDVTGTALETANQIAFRWAMSCANDIIEGLVSVAPTGAGGNQANASVPEPETILLMLIGMAGIAYRRKIS
ncbi:PEP-CTERM sorting domain-containing protein [Thalassotalea piscium]